MYPSPPSRAAWIEIWIDTVCYRSGTRRRLHGRRGLKSYPHSRICSICTSPPSRAAWIEIQTSVPPAAMSTSPPSRAAWIEMIQPLLRIACPQASPPSRAAWIEILNLFQANSSRIRRRLHGRRGLKFADFLQTLFLPQSPPSRAAWIEIKI